MFNKYYQDELAYLRDMGREFAERNPESAGWLAQPGVDPDVERLIEGFAFLTARIRQKLDDELPEFTHSLLEMFWPHYLRHLPSMTVMQFTSKPKAVGKLQSVERGAQVASRPVDDTPCLFRVCYETPIVPLETSEVEIGPSGSPYVLVRFKVAKRGILPKLGLDRLRLHLAGTSAASRALYLTLRRYTKGIRVRGEKGGEVAVAGVSIDPVGFDDDQGLFPMPENAFPGFRLLHEYFAFPGKFMFLDVSGLGAGLSEVGGGNWIELIFDLDHLPHDMPPVDAANIQLNCSPAVNLFEHDADPIRLDSRRVEYKVRPGGPAANFEVFSVDSVRGVRRSEPEPRLYDPFFRTFRVHGKETLLYKTRVQDAQTTEGTDLWISFLEGGAPASYGDETVSIALTCSNRSLPTALGLGDLDQSTRGSPKFADFRNVTAPTPPVPPPLSGDLFWSLVSHMSLNYLSLLKPEALRELLRLYDFRARYDRQAERTLARKLEGITAVRHTPRLKVYEGSAVRGVGVELDLDEERFGGEGEIYLFGSVLERFLAHYVTLNAFSEMSVRGKKYGEVHRWPARTGARPIL